MLTDSYLVSKAHYDKTQAIATYKLSLNISLPHTKQILNVQFIYYKQKNLSEVGSPIIQTSNGITNAAVLPLPKVEMKI